MRRPEKTTGSNRPGQHHYRQDLAIDLLLYFAQWGSPLPHIKLLGGIALDYLDVKCCDVCGAQKTHGPLHEGGADAVAEVVGMHVHGAKFGGVGCAVDPRCG